MSNGAVVSSDLVALALVMEAQLALDDAVRVLMSRKDLDQREATEAMVRAAAFAWEQYGAYPVDRHVVEAL